MTESLDGWLRAVSNRHSCPSLADKTRNLLWHLERFHVRWDGQGPYFSAPRHLLAAGLGVAEARITERMADAVASGLLVRTVRGQKGVTAVYRPSIQGTELRSAEPVQGTEERSAEVESQGPSVRSAESQNRSAEPVQGTEERSAIYRTTTDDGFEDWWNLYPRKMNKGPAREAYTKALTKTDTETLGASLKAQLPSLAAAGTYCPFPKTWLDNERWTDDVTATNIRVTGDGEMWDLGDWAPRPTRPGK